MNNDKIITIQLEQEFAAVDSIITAHTNSAIAKVNAEALQTYWDVGAFISDRLKNAQWGNHVVSELADYLKRHNPKRRGYGKRNLYNMVMFYDNYSSSKFQEVTEQLWHSEFVQSGIAQIEARPIVQMSSAKKRGGLKLCSRELHNLKIHLFLPSLALIHSLIHKERIQEVTNTITYHYEKKFSLYGCRCADDAQCLWRN